MVVSLSPYVTRSRHFVPVWLSLRSIDVEFFSRFEVPISDTL